MPKIDSNSSGRQTLRCVLNAVLILIVLQEIKTADLYH